MTPKTNHIIQMDFVDALFKQPAPNPKTCAQTQKNKRKVLPPNQQAGFRNEYNEAMITLYIIGSLFKSAESRKEMPKEILHDFEKAKKSQIRYERYMPKAAQNIIHYGRDVVDAYMSPDHTYLHTLEEEAERSKYPQKRHICSFAKRTIDRMVGIIQLYNEII